MNREERIAELQAKLKLREGKPGFAANAELIRSQIAGLEGLGFRDTATGEFVTLEQATANPDSVEPA